MQNKTKNQSMTSERGSNRKENKIGFKKKSLTFKLYIKLI
jgi:hypothetical protein